TLPAGGPLCEQDSSGGSTSPVARRTADEIRAGHQPQDRQSARPHHPAIAAPAGGSGHRVMDRRAFVTGLGAVLATPLAAEAQTTGQPHRIGFLNAAAGQVEGVLREALRSLGYVEGANLVIEAKAAHGIV